MRNWGNNGRFGNSGFTNPGGLNNAPQGNNFGVNQQMGTGYQYGNINMGHQPTQNNFHPNNRKMNVEPFNPPKKRYEPLYQHILSSLLKDGLDKSLKPTSKNKGFSCTMLDPNNFGITINLVNDTTYKHLQPFIYAADMSAANADFGEIINDEYLNKTAFFSSDLASIKQNLGIHDRTSGSYVQMFMQDLHEYVMTVARYVQQFIFIDNMGEIAQIPELQQALRFRYRFAGINITPVTNINPQTRQPFISMLYSLSEDVTIHLKQDQYYMDNKL